MNNFKTIISPSKTFNTNIKSYKSGKRPKYIKNSKSIFNKIRVLGEVETKVVYKLSDSKSKEVYELNQEHGQKLYKAIELYNGLVYKQLELKTLDRKWLNDHIIILDALYGVIKPDDLISPYRLDFKTNLDLDLKSIWKTKINQELKGFTIINLASKEFSSLVNLPLKEVKLPKGQIKQMRGKLLNKIIKNKSIKEI